MRPTLAEVLKKKADLDKKNEAMERVRVEFVFSLSLLSLLSALCSVFADWSCLLWRAHLSFLIVGTDAERFLQEYAAKGPREKVPSYETRSSMAQ